jgi:hypothetical protein
LTSRCTGCHGAKVLKAGLRLHRKVDLLAGGDNGPVVLPGRSAESRLIHYVSGALEKKIMPPAGERLTPAQVGLLRAWIDQGAVMPEDSAWADAPGSLHWAFRPVVRPRVPRVKASNWVRNAIDAFVLARLEKQGLRPSPAADRVTLLRRASLDLTGLPPTPAEVDAFVADPSPDAYESTVDRLLASPHYGERWGRHWLDLARYADSNGYTIDSARTIWLYRDWVIQALNADMPFDQFTIQQLAGDLLDPGPAGSQVPPGMDPRVATGFHRNTTINEEGGTDPEQFRVEAVVDRVNTTGSVWLGLTVGCAQCHTHKYDPITQREYYQLFAFFNDQEEPVLSLAGAEQTRQHEQLAAELAAAKKALADYDAAHPEKGETSKTEAPERKPLATRVDDLTARERELARILPTTLILSERTTPRSTHVHLRGDFLRPGVEVQPGVPSVLPGLAAATGGGRPGDQQSPPGPRRPNRLDLARWLVGPDNPLTARVTANRIWMQYFGRGLVETENDFGSQGTRPTHPELLDWLAVAFREGNGSPGTPGDGGAGPTRSPLPAARVAAAARPWSLKALHRLIVTSATYRQSARARADLAKIDPDNRLLARQARLRLDAEVLRDSALAASGLLCDRIGGPSVFPPQPAGLDLFTQNKKNWTTSEGDDRYRRGLYTFIWRSSPYPLFTTFDGPSGNNSCTRRARSNTPLGALMLANDASLFEAARGLAATMLRDAPPGDRERVRYAFRRCLAREPAPPELDRLLAYCRSQRQRFRDRAPAAKAAAPPSLPGGTDPAEAAAWTAVARVLMNLDEFVTRE